MKEVAIFVGGLALGAYAAGMLIEPSDCCVRVAAGVREQVGTKLGSTAQSIGDLFGVWKFTPGLLTLFGVKA